MYVYGCGKDSIYVINRVCSVYVCSKACLFLCVLLRMCVVLVIYLCVCISVFM